MKPFCFNKTSAYLWGAVVLLAVFFTLPVHAGHMLSNGSFESYDAQTLVPQGWQVTGKSVKIYTDQAYEGSVSLFCPGGTMENGVDTPNPDQSGTVEQLVDLSTIADWNQVNWIKMGINGRYILWGATSVTLTLDYLPPAYNNQTIALDDPAWDGPDVINHTRSFRTSHSSASNPWRTMGGYGAQVPKVRWARARIVFESQFKDHSSFEGGLYYIAVDDLSLTAEAVYPDDPCQDNLLANPGFESLTGNQIHDWTLLTGQMDNIPGAVLTPYAGNTHMGNVGGYFSPDGQSGMTDHPNPVQSGMAAQVIDLSLLDGWEESSIIQFSFSGYFLKYNIQSLAFLVEYLPPSYNETSIAPDDPAWEGDDKKIVFNDEEQGSFNTWQKFETDTGALPKIRWMRVALVLDTAPARTDLAVEYMGAFDQVCLRANALAVPELILNPDFEQGADTPSQWHKDPGASPAQLLADPIPAHSGEYWLGRTTGTGTARYYQVIDLADKIPGWLAINSTDGSAVIYPFIKCGISAATASTGGAVVGLGLEYLPYSYNTREDIAWDNDAWQSRLWSSDGTDFTNAGGDAIDLGVLIRDQDGEAAPEWKENTLEYWLPRVRWLRIRVELDMDGVSADSGLAGIDGLNLFASCEPYGPYAGFGRLPEANYPGPANALDQGIPGWTGPEGDGICGGYSGKTQLNYVNPAFAGFADGYTDYAPSGQYIYMGYDGCPQCITGPPWNDSTWNKVIITLGDMDLAMQADYFGPAPSGTYAPGQITATFHETPIVNGPGHDFVTFENGFVLGWTSDRIFGELAFVEVSSNGTDFIRFPTHSLTPFWPGAYGTFVASGVFGMTGKHVNAYGDSWGTPFDLEWLADHPLVLNGTVDLNDIRYVRQVDVPGGGPKDAQDQYTGMFLDSYGHVIFDSWVTWGSGGADLDAIGVLNTSASDWDGDQISDFWDNCTQTSNARQYDTDKDGVGNACDCDINGDAGGDGVVNFMDFVVFRAAYGGQGPERIPGEPGQPDIYTEPSENWNPDADFNADNVVNFADFVIFRSRYGASGPFN